MAFGHPVYIAAQIERQTAHVQGVLSSQFFQIVEVILIIQDLVHQIVSKLVMPRLYRGMGGEDAGVAYPVEIETVVAFPVWRVIAPVALRQFHAQ